MLSQKNVQYLHHVAPVANREIRADLQEEDLRKALDAWSEEGASAMYAHTCMDGRVKRGRWVTAQEYVHAR